jgi:hypothetical protein
MTCQRVDITDLTLKCSCDHDCWEAHITDFGSPHCEAWLAVIKTDKTGNLFLTRETMTQLRDYLNAQLAKERG